MNGKATRHFIIFLLVLTVILLVGVCVVRRKTGFKAKNWLAQHGQVAESYAMAILAGQTSAVPSALSAMKVESGKDWVSFGILVGPFYSHGLLFSPSGTKTRQGLGGEPEIKEWEHIRGDWYYWVAD